MLNRVVSSVYSVNKEQTWIARLPCALRNLIPKRSCFYSAVDMTVKHKLEILIFFKGFYEFVCNGYTDIGVCDARAIVFAVDKLSNIWVIDAQDKHHGSFAERARRLRKGFS